MASKLKAFGLVLVAVFALGAMSASGASAMSTFSSEAEHTILDASALETQVFNTTPGKIECKKVSIDDATILSATKSTSEVTVKPTYEECSTVLGGTARNVRVQTTTCHYLFTAETTGEHGTVHIKCTTPGDVIDVEAEIVKGVWSPCVTVPEQTIGGIHYEGTTSATPKSDIDINPTATGIKYTEHGVCGSATLENGTYNGKVTVKGTDTTGNPVGIDYTP